MFSNTSAVKQKMVGAILTLFVISIFTPHVVSARIATDAEVNGYPAGCNGSTDCLTAHIRRICGTDQECLTDASSRLGVSEITAAQAAAVENESYFGGVMTSTVKYIWQWIASMILALFGAIVGFAGVLLNLSINAFVIGMGNAFQSGIGLAVENGWRVVRDFVNITLVFGLIYAGLMTILDRGHTRHLIVSIIISALLVNFSLYFSKVIIDISNIATVQIYNQIESLDRSGGVSIANPTGGGISGAIATKLGLVSLLDANRLKNPDQINTGATPGFVQVLLSCLIMLVAAFVFGAGAIMLATRFVALILLMIFSPMAFFIHLPRFPHWREQWWEKMISNAIFAPAYLFVVWLAFAVMNTQALSANLNGIGSALSGNVPDIGAILNFFIICIFLLGALKVAKETGIAGASFATKTAGRMTFGLTAAMGRSTLGRAGYALANSKTLEKADKAGGVTGFVARRALGASRLAASSSYDVRGVKGVKDALKSQFAADPGDAQKGGFTARVEAAKEAVKKQAEALKVDDNDPRVLARKRTLELNQETLEHEENELKDFRQERNQMKVNASAAANDLAQRRDELQKLRDSRDATADVQERIRLDEQIGRKNNEVDQAEKKVSLANNSVQQLDTQITAQEAKIKGAKKAVELAKENIEKEKNRRVAGSPISTAEASDADYIKYKDKIKEAKTNLTAAVDEFRAASTPEAMRLAEQKIKDTQEIIKKAEKAQTEVINKLRMDGKSSGEVGFADTVERAGWFSSTFRGRNRTINREAAKAVRSMKGKGKSDKKEKKEEKKEEAHAEEHKEEGGDHGGGGGHH